MATDTVDQTGHSSEQGTLSALRDGDQAETARFVREHIGWMLAVARRILRDSDQAEDAVQDAFANIFKHLETFDGRSSLKTWMHRIVVNQALMALRKRGRTKEDPIDHLLPEFDRFGCRVEDDWTHFETPESLLQRSQVRGRISEFIDQLPEQYRIVLVLRDIEELSTVDVAEALGLSESNVKVRLHRARAALKKLLEPLMRGQSL